MRRMPNQGQEKGLSETEDRELKKKESSVDWRLEKKLSQEMLSTDLKELGEIRNSAKDLRTVPAAQMIGSGNKRVSESATCFRPSRTEVR